MENDGFTAIAHLLFGLTAFTGAKLMNRENSYLRLVIMIFGAINLFLSLSYGIKAVFNV